MNKPNVLFLFSDQQRWDTVSCYGQPLEFTESTSIIKGFPASVGNHIDIYHKKQLYYIKPQPDSRVTIKWGSYLDKLTKERDK